MTHFGTSLSKHLIFPSFLSEELVWIKDYVTNQLDFVTRLEKCIYIYMCVKEVYNNLVLYFIVCLNLFWLDLTETSDGTSNSYSRSSAEGVSSTGHDLLTRFAVPDSAIGTFDRIFPTKGTTIRWVLTDLNLSHKLAKCSTITSTILSSDSDLLGAFSHFVFIFVLYYKKN